MMPICIFSARSGWRYFRCWKFESVPALGGARPLWARARAPVCPSLATPLCHRPPEPSSCVWYLLSLWWMGLEMLKFIQRLQLLLLSSISPQAIEHVLRIMYNNNCLLVPYVVESSLKFLISGAVCTLHMGIIYMLYYFTTHSIFNPAFIKFLNWFCQWKERKIR